jgi:hypothetical protein
MKEEETAPLQLLLNALDVNRKNFEKINWQEEFIIYIQKNNLNLYNEARIHTNELEENGWFTKEEKKKWEE